MEKGGENSVTSAIDNVAISKLISGRTVCNLNIVRACFVERSKSCLSRSLLSNCACHSPHTNGFIVKDSQTGVPVFGTCSVRCYALFVVIVFQIF